MSLIIVQSKLQELMLMQTSWAATLNPIIAKPQAQANILPNVTLIAGANTINHLLGRKMQGWTLTDINGAATIYRSQPLNDITLTLTSSAAVTVSIGVF